MKSKISIITLGVKDFEKSLIFYRDGLGFKPHNYKTGDTYVMFEMNGTWLALFPNDNLAEDAGVPMATHGAGRPSFTLAQNVASPDEVDQVISFAIKAGATLIKAPQKAAWGGYAGYFADPDNYFWEIAHNPFTDLT
jgi:hypothetical protein